MILPGALPGKRMRSLPVAVLCCPRLSCDHADYVPNTTGPGLGTLLPPLPGVEVEPMNYPLVNQTLSFTQQLAEPTC